MQNPVGLALSLAGIVRQAGAGMKELCGWTPDQTVGRRFALLLDPVDRPAFKQALEAAVHHPGVPQQIQVRLVDSGRSVGMCLLRHALVKDILVDLVPDASAAVASGTGPSQEFDPNVAHVLHELAHPLTPLRLQVALLRRRPEIGPFDRHLHIMEKNVGLLERLVQDLQQAFLKGGASLRKADVDLEKIATEAVDSMTRQAADRGIEVDLRTQRTPVHGDADRLAQVLLNLVGNAIKFTPEGGRIVVATAQDGGWAELSVQDTGLGLEPEERSRLFRPFSRPHQDRPGLGLGLYICRIWVERHGGRIWCESGGRGQGTTFRVRLPLRGAPFS